MPLKKKLQEAEEDMALVRREGVELHRTLAAITLKEKKEITEKILSIQAQGKALEAQV